MAVLPRVAQQQNTVRAEEVLRRRREASAITRGARLGVRGRKEDASRGDRSGLRSRCVSHRVAGREREGAAGKASGDAEGARPTSAVHVSCRGKTR